MPALSQGKLSGCYCGGECAPGAIGYQQIGDAVWSSSNKTALEAALAHDKYIHDNGLVRPMNFQNPYEVEARAAESKST